MALLLFCVVFLAVAPGYFDLMHDSNAGNQLAKGLQILFGRHPWLHVDSSVYGPAVFYLSALGQSMDGERLLPEIIIIFVGYLASYGLLFRAFRHLTAHRFAFALLVVLLLGAFPPFHKYHVLLPQALFLWGSHRALNAAGPRSMALWLSLVSALAGSMRLDLGAYCVLCAVLMLALRYAALGWRAVLRHVAVFIGTGILLTSPWWIFLVASSNPVELVVTSAETARGALVGLGTPPPVYRFGASPFTPENSLLLVFWFLRLAAPVVGVAAMVRMLSRGRSVGQRSDDEPSDLFLLVASLFATLVFLQASHRVDLSHVKQCAPATLFVLVLAPARWARGRAMPRAIPRAAAMVAITVVGVWLGQALLHPRLREASSYSPARWAQTMRSWHLTRAAALTASASRHPEPAVPIVFRRVRALTKADDAVLFLPFLAQAYYFTGRHFETPHGWWNPGRFLSVGSQQRFIDSMAATEIVVDRPDFAFDRRPERNARVYASEVMSHVYTTYGLFDVIGGFVLASRRADIWQREGRYDLELRTLGQRATGDLAHPTTTYRPSHVNTLPVSAARRRFSMPAGAGLLLAMEPIDPAAPQKPCRRVGLVGGDKILCVTRGGTPIGAPNLQGRRLIDTGAAEAVSYRVVLMPCRPHGALDSDLEDSGVSITFVR